MAFTLQTTFYILINYKCIVDSYSNGHVIQKIAAGWISFLLLPQSLVWLLGFGGNHSPSFVVHYCHHHIETRQIQKYVKKMCGLKFFNWN